MPDLLSGDEKEKQERGRYLSAPPFMYTFFLFLVLVLVVVVTDAYLDVRGMAIASRCIAIVLLGEALNLLFLEPTVELFRDRLEFESLRTSVWCRPPGLFRWDFHRTEKTLEMEEVEAIEVNFTRVPFPLPIWPLSEGLSFLYRWMVCIRGEEGEYFLCGLGSRPENIADLARRAGEYTGLSVDRPWKQEEHPDANESAYYFSGEETFDGPGEEKTVPLGRTWSPGRRLLSGVASLVCFFGTVFLVFSGLEGDWTSVSLIGNIGFMILGGALLWPAIVLAVGTLADTRKKLRLGPDHLHMESFFGRSREIPLDDLKAIVAVREEEGLSTEFGSGKPVPLLEIYAENEWLPVEVETEEHLDRLLEELLPPGPSSVSGHSGG